MRCLKRPGPYRRGLQVLAKLIIWGAVAGCSSLDDPPEGGQCLPYPQLKKRCDMAFSQCLDSSIQGIWSETYGHSMCHVCKDVCMRQNGVWPDAVDDRPCK
jgi:hypothetical protein